MCVVSLKLARSLLIALRALVISLVARHVAEPLAGQLRTSIEETQPGWRILGWDGDLSGLGLQRPGGLDRGGVDGCFGAAVQPELGQDRADVVLDRAHRVVQFGGDFVVGAACAQPLEDYLLAGAQQGRRVGRMWGAGCLEPELVQQCGTARRLG
jgi:hypothetical protein